MKRYSNLLLALSIMTSLLLPNLAIADQPFNDVNEPFAYTTSIAWAKDEELVKGYEDGSFKPWQTVNRAEALTMIMRLAEQEEALKEDNEFEIEEPLAFSDVDPSSWYSSVIETASEKGIVKGTSPQIFEPEKEVNRAEALKMLVRATGKTHELPSVASDPWYAPYMEYAKTHALLIPDKKGDFLSSQNLTRGEMAELMYRFVKKPYTTGIEYGVASYYGWSYDGHNTASGKALDAHGKMAAHKSLPFGTKLHVTNVDSLKSVIVEVVDRGPYTEGYVVDLTPAAFEVLEPLSVGLSQVRVEVLK